MALSSSARSSSLPRSSSPASDHYDRQQETHARLRRRIAELEAEVTAQRTPAPARSSKTYVTMGRAIKKTVSLFDPIEAMVSEYDRRQELEDEREEDADDTPVLHTDEYAMVDLRSRHSLTLHRDPRQDRLYRGFQELQKFIPTIKVALLNMDPSELSSMFSQLQKGAAGAFGDDVNSVRAAMAEFLNYPGAKDLLVASSRTNRGVEGEITRAYIFPVDYDHTDPAVREKVINGDPDYKITADQWPRGVYQNGIYDAANPTKGLFKSTSLLQTYLHLFTAPQSAKKLQEEADKEKRLVNASEPDSENVRPSASEDAQPPRKKRRLAAAPVTSKKSVASKISLRHVTPRSLAYACVHHRFALSDAASWNEVDGDFEYVVYYNNIVDWFENAPGPVAQKEAAELLAWWDQRVFKNNCVRVVSQPSQQSSSIRAMRELRVARELNV
ncbi:hypothetical protein C8R45DRAFT_939672 [Mycena sanguinolenta]|nr:hypothetical protein C8R45DRAFT_939672 [Mycena sanguinolenta]